MESFLLGYAGFVRRILKACVVLVPSGLKAASAPVALGHGLGGSHGHPSTADVESSLSLDARLLKTRACRS